MMETPSEHPAKLPSMPSSSRPSSREKLTAEERLFKAIENGGVTVDKGDKGDEGRGVNFSAGLSRILESLKRFSPLKAREGGRPIKSSGFDLAFVNRMLGALVGLGLVGSIANSFFFKPDINRVYNRVVQMTVSSGNGPAVAVRKPVDEYVASIAQRNLFQPGAKIEAMPTTAGPSSLPSGGVEETLSNLQLVGISWGAYPEAMIRDKKEGRTYFIKQGLQFKGVLVKEIQKDRIVVEYGGHVKELM